MKLSGNTVLITGGSMGIGFAMAEFFLNKENTVLICARRKERLLEAQKKHPELHIKVCDVAKEKDRKVLLEWTTGNFSNLNVLVNNAGVQRYIDFTQGINDYLGGENEIKINLEAPIILSGMFIPYLTGKEGAAIINVSSGLGFVPAARTPVYSATKAGLHAFSMALRHQLKDQEIKVYEVVPPAVDTELNPEGRAASNYRPDLKPDQFVAGIMTGLEKDEFEIGYGYSEGLIKASRAELDKRFHQMNSDW